MKLRIPYFVAAILATSSLLHLADTPGLSAAQLVSFNTTSGHNVDLAAPQGKTRLVSFWAPDCPISERDMPELSQLHEQFQDDKFEVIAVAMPYAKGADVTLSTGDYNYPVAHDVDGNISKGFPGVRFTPTTFLINGDGKIVWRHVGKLDAAQTADNIIKTIKPDSLATGTMQLVADGR